MRATNNGHIPMEIIEEILLNLSPKSLLRFSSVSKHWNSIIFKSGFIKRYRGHKRIALKARRDKNYDNGSACILSSISFENPAPAGTTNFNCPFGRYPTLKAFCDELWFALDGKSQSFFLWNPSTRLYKKLPHPSLKPCRRTIFGLGYESVGDDYKILKIPLTIQDCDEYAELYSMRSDSWRKISPSTRNIAGGEHGVELEATYGVFVSGKLHWTSHPINTSNRPGAAAIICFDLLTEKLGVVEQPKYSLNPPMTAFSEVTPRWGLSVLRGKLCVSLNYMNSRDIYDNTCIIWMMEDYGVAKSWTKKFSIKCNLIFGDEFHRSFPLYFYKNGELLIRVARGHENRSRIFVYKDEKSKPKEVDYSGNVCGDYIGLMYVDSLAMHQY